MHHIFAGASRATRDPSERAAAGRFPFPVATQAAATASVHGPLQTSTAHTRHDTLHLTLRSAHSHRLHWMLWSTPHVQLWAVRRRGRDPPRRSRMTITYVCTNPIDVLPTRLTARPHSHAIEVAHRRLAQPGTVWSATCGHVALLCPLKVSVLVPRVICTAGAPPLSLCASRRDRRPTSRRWWAGTHSQLCAPRIRSSSPPHSLQIKRSHMLGNSSRLARLQAHTRQCASRGTDPARGRH